LPPHYLPGHDLLQKQKLYYENNFPHKWVLLENNMAVNPNTTSATIIHEKWIMVSWGISGIE